MRAVALAPVGVNSNQVEFTTDIVLNQPANKIAIECPSDLHLEAGESRDIVMLLGAAESEEAVRSIIERHRPQL